MFIRSTRSSRTRYRPQTKFGARSCFYTCLSFCSHGGGGVPSLHHSITGHMTRRVCIWGVCLQREVCICGVLPRGGGLHPEREGVFLQGGASRAGGGLPPGRCIQSGRGFSSRRGWADPPNQVPRDSQQAGGTYPTGMHSCCKLDSVYMKIRVLVLVNNKALESKAIQ